MCCPILEIEPVEFNACLLRGSLASSGGVCGWGGAQGHGAGLGGRLLAGLVGGAVG
jgi:hypothetical protein